MKFDKTELYAVTQFTYVENILSTDCTADAEINQMISKASASFAQIRKRVIFKLNLRLATQVAFYKAICMSVLFCAGETLTLYRRHCRQLKSFHIQCLKKDSQVDLAT